MRKEPLYAFIGLHAALLIWAGIMAKGPSAWGLHAWGYLSPFMLAVLVVASAAAALTVIVGWAFPRRPPGFGILAGVSAVLFFVFHDRAHLLGDGQLWISVLRKNPVYHADEPLAFALPWLVTRGNTDNIGWFIHRLELWSVVLGVMAALIAARIALRVADAPRGRWLTFFLLMGPGLVQFGFGYVEAYPALWVAVLLLVWATLRVLETGKGWDLLGLALGLAVAVHTQGALLIVPMIVLFVVHRVRWLDIGVVLGVAVFPVLFAYGLLPFLMPSAGGSAGLGNVLAGAEQIVKGITLYSQGISAWLQDQVNRWSLAAPLMLGLIIVAALNGAFRSDPDAPSSQSQSRNSTLWVLGATAFMLMLPALVLDFPGSRGSSADWDMFAVAGVPLAALAAFLWAPRLKPEPDLRIPLGIAVFFIVATGFSFVLVNASETAAPRRMEALATSPHWTRNAKGLAYENLATYYRDIGDTTRAVAMYSRALDFQGGNVRLLRNTALSLFNQERYPEAVEAYRRLLDRDDTNPADWVNYASVLLSTDHREEARVALLSALKLDDRNIDALNLIARILLMPPTDKPAATQAYGYLQKSLDVAPGQPFAEGIRKTLEGLRARGVGPPE